MLKQIMLIVAMSGLLFANESTVPVTEQTSIQSQDVKETQVQRFVNASNQVNIERAKIEQEINQKYSKSGSKPSNEVIKSFNEKFMQKAQAAIRDNDLSIKQYNLYAKLYKNSVDFQERVQEYILKQKQQ